MFIDLAENIHIHHREYRTVFSLDEYFEYVDIIKRSTEDVRDFLASNREYREMTYPTTLMVGGGRAQQLRYLRNSPKSNQSAYYNNEMAVELQDEYVTDEIHIHYRDFRIAMDRERFIKFSDCIYESREQLKKYLNENTYTRKSHADREIKEFNDLNGDVSDKRGNILSVELNEIESYWYKDFFNEFQPTSKYVNDLVQRYRDNSISIPPVILCNNDSNNSKYLIVDGHHRTYAAYLVGNKTVDALVLDIGFNQTEKIRKAEVLLKEFDKDTGYEYSLSYYFKDFLSHATNRYYENLYSKRLFRNTIFFRFLRRIKRKLVGNEAVFRNFNDYLSNKK